MRYKIESYESLVKKGYDKRNIIKKLLELVNQTLQDISLASIGEIDQWLSIVDKIPNSSRILFDTKTNEMVGHWFFTGIGEKMYQKAIKGDLHEINMTLENVCHLNKPTVCYGYFNQIEILKEHRTTSNFKMLIESFFEVLENYALKEIFFFEWITLAASLDGEKMARNLGLKYVCDHQMDGKIFSGNIFSMSNLRILSKYPKLIKAYSEFKEDF